MDAFPSPRPFRPLLALAALVLLALPARAAYTVTVTGGRWTSTGSHTLGRGDVNGVGGCPTGGGNDYSPTNYVFTAGAGTATCSGAMTAHLHWDGSDPRPPAIVVEEVAVAAWQGDGGSCSTGLPNPVATPIDGGGETRRSVRYTVITDPGADLSLPSVSPAANATSQGSGGSDDGADPPPIDPLEAPRGGALDAAPPPAPGTPAGGASVSYSVSVTPVSIESDFAIRTGNKFNFLLGQQADFYVSAGNYTIVPQGNWTIPGDHIRGVDLSGEGTNGDYGSYYSQRSTDQGFDGSVAHPSVYFEGTKDQVEVSRPIQLYDGNVYAASLTPKRIVVVHKPDVATMEVRGTGPCTINDADLSSIGDPEVAEARDDSQFFSGFVVAGQVTLPALFTGPQGEGRWSFAQTYRRQREYDDVQGHPQEQDSETQGLDNAYPYPFVYDAETKDQVFVWRTTSDGRVYDLYDAPSIGISGWFGYFDYFHGDTFMVLHPPYSPGQSVVDLPLGHVPWDYTSVSTRSASDLLWQDRAYCETSVGYITSPADGTLVPGSVEQPVESYEMDWNQANMY